jgi:hypothetical protein
VAAANITYLGDEVLTMFRDMKFNIFPYILRQSAIKIIKGRGYSRLDFYLPKMANNLNIYHRLWGHRRHPESPNKPGRPENLGFAFTHFQK